MTSIVSIIIGRPLIGFLVSGNGMSKWSPAAIRKGSYLNAGTSKSFKLGISPTHDWKQSISLPALIGEMVLIANVIIRILTEVTTPRPLLNQSKLLSGCDRVGER